jgi:hypothetical protein
MQSEEKTRLIMGIAVKKDTTRANVWALPMIFFVTTSAGAYYNAQQVSILKSPNFFNVP